MGSGTVVVTVMALAFALDAHAGFQTPAGSGGAVSIAGDWVGGFRQDNNWVLVQARFDNDGATIRGTMTLGNAGGRGVELSDLSQRGSAVRFRLVTGPRDVQFEGTLDGTSLAGTARGTRAATGPASPESEWTGPLHLSRVRPLDEKTLREYDGTYQWGPNAFVYLQVWNELTAVDRLVAFDESGDRASVVPDRSRPLLRRTGRRVPDRCGIARDISA